MLEIGERESKGKREGVTKGGRKEILVVWRVGEAGTEFVTWKRRVPGIKWAVRWSVLLMRIEFWGRKKA